MSLNQKHLKGNIYLGKVTRIEASLQAAFIEIGSEKNAFLAFGEIHNKNLYVLLHLVEGEKISILQPSEIICPKLGFGEY